MNIYWFIIIFSAWYVFALVVSEKIGKFRKIGEEWSFFLSIMLSPVIGLAITLFTKKMD
jgi:magnesium-transporting ATPase (P-type)